MHANETLKPHFTERINNPNLPTPEAGPKKEKTWVEKLTTSVLDLGRDIVSANQMAKEKFDGSSALMQAAKGTTTALIGVGLEKAMDEYFDGVMSGKEPILGRTNARFGENFQKVIKGLEKTNPRMHHFIVQSTKDLVVGGAYNGLAFFSRPILESARAEHLVGSLGVNATEAMFTKGLSYPREVAEVAKKREALNTRDSTQVQRLRELQHNDSPETPAKRLEAIQERLRVFKERKLITDPTDTPLEWQTFVRKFTAYSNPATLLGLDMIGNSMKTFTKNLKDIRKVRKEKGGLAGKKVEMPKKGGWQDRGDRGGFQPRTGDRREQHSWQDKKDKVYYGQSNKVVSREEEDLAKAL